ncbi:hypothetical protein TNCV_1441651 [Trichonephila clavipes]|uniref:Uncharacterized protein n=1 Tax=Trichonephila clavipes TaxID=2585209 RepID=A0A8X6RJK2_TRICX|nr:hypothetical protein TNCV_1441651 [Trichonephila clavipes]
MPLNPMLPCDENCKSQTLSLKPISICLRKNLIYGGNSPPGGVACLQLFLQAAAFFVATLALRPNLFYAHISACSFLFVLPFSANGPSHMHSS